MPADANTIIGIGLTVVGVVGIPLGVVLVKMWARGEAHEQDIKELRSNHAQLEAKVDSTVANFNDLKVFIAGEFGKMTEQLRTLFNNQDRHQ